MPEDIPESIWDAARSLWLNDISLGADVNENIAHIARAIMTERERAAGAAPTQEELLKLWTLVEKFVADQRIDCSETVYQVDRVIENGYEFIDAACEIVGFYKD